MKQDFLAKGKQLNFFARLEPLRDFLKFDHDELYVDVPLDWWVVLTDVQGSTEAIQRGRYKDVNMAGASTIAALLNVMKGELFPFVFGGDGATALIPYERKAEIESALRCSQKIIKDHFDLNLRVGVISVAELYSFNHSIKVCRYELEGGPSLAFFRGDGLEAAEKIIKSGHKFLESGFIGDPEKVLAGLSCRWAPLQSQRGHMLTIMIKATAIGEKNGILSKVASQIHDIVDLNSPETHPIKSHQLKGASLGSASATELRLKAFEPSWFNSDRIKIILQMLIVRLLLMTGYKLRGLDINAYSQSISLHSDFRKYDSTLRMVIDCSDAMTTQINQMLQSYQDKGSIFFGTHSSKSALMTCFVHSIDPGKHIHFVDGNDGGYALAAQKLKKQIGTSLDG